MGLALGWCPAKRAALTASCVSPLPDLRWLLPPVPGLAGGDTAIYKTKAHDRGAAAATAGMPLAIASAGHGRARVAVRVALLRAQETGDVLPRRRGYRSGPSACRCEHSVLMRT